MTREKLEDIIKTENTKVEPLDNMEDFMSGGAIEEDDDLETFEDEDEAVVLPLTSCKTDICSINNTFVLWDGSFLI